YDFARAKPKEIEPFIKTLGLYRNKAKNLILAAQKVIAEFNGKIPRDREELETLAGVGHKTSAVIVANAFHEPAIAVDTHVARVSFRLGLTKNTNPNKIEADLDELFPKKDRLKVPITLVFHGRRICIARKPYCSICPVNDACPRDGVKTSQ
ncbi:MAG TPA: endonuclease III, partial [Myxococcota bacterium]|nr:endonuclease III [Myxococcota bacterium]